ncbi:Dynamitin-domain-containing protein [Paraphysoderma sedebokerense]|nr:Dynamitin-domain-containing protein [Paraphysoderma sedebokerense]
MIEVNELGEDIEKSIKDNSQAEKKELSNPSLLLNQLTNLETQLETYNARLTSSSTIDSSQSAPQGGAISNLNTKHLLMSHLKSFREGAVSEKSVSKGLEAKQNLDANGVTYELYYSPDTSNLVRSTKMSELDQRITLLEKIIGIGSGSMGNEVPSTPVVPLLNRLDHHLSLLTNPRNLDILSRKLKQLTLEMEKVAELQKRAAHMGTGGSSDKDGSFTIRKEMESKINHLFNITAQIDPLIHLAPQLLTRLSQLHNLHLEATSFSEGLKKLGNDVDKCGKGVDEVKGLAETVGLALLFSSTSFACSMVLTRASYSLLPMAYHISARKINSRECANCPKEYYCN